MIEITDHDRAIATAALRRHSESYREDRDNADLVGEIAKAVAAAREEGRREALAGKTAILEDGLKWNQITMTNADAEFMESRRFQLEDIARAFRVPRFTPTAVWHRITLMLLP